MCHVPADLARGWATGKSCFESRRGQTLLFVTAVETTAVSSQAYCLIACVDPWGVKWPEREADHSLLVTKLKLRGSIP
jgi:hypothetical protein